MIQWNELGKLEYKSSILIESIISNNYIKIKMLEKNQGNYNIKNNFDDGTRKELYL